MSFRVRVPARLLTCLAAVATAAVLTAGRPGAQVSPTPQRFEGVEPHMGTLVRITVYTPGPAEAKAAFRAAFDRIGELDRTLSDYKPDSELNEITRTAVGWPARVSDDLFAVLQASQELAAATGGAFDITQGPVVRLWREARTTGRLPEAAALAEARRRTGFRKLHLNTGERTVLFEITGMALDVGAIGKGYAASEALEVLGRLGIRSALVAVSGDLAFSDAPPDARGWRIRLHEGEKGLESLPPVIELTRAAVSTSGPAEQFVEIDGRRYSHVIDPASGQGLAGDRTVTVVAPHGLEADGLDTAVSVLGIEKGLKLVEDRPGAAALIVERRQGLARFMASSGFRKLLARPQ